MTSVVILTIT